MAIRIELTPEEEEQLRRRATSQGVRPEELLAQLVRAQLMPTGNGDQAFLPPVLDEQGVFHPDRLEAIHRFFARASNGLPSLPDEALTRKALYQDHD